MSPPSYSDLGKEARDLFYNGYHIGEVNVDFKMKTKAGIEITTGNSLNLENNATVKSILQTAYETNDYSISLFKQSLSGSNRLSTEVSHTDKFLRGLRIAFEGSILQQNPYNDSKLKLSYAENMIKLDSMINIDVTRPVIYASLVLSYNESLVGYQATFDPTDSRLVTNNFAIGYKYKDVTVHVNVKDGEEFTGSIYHNLKKNLSYAFQFLWNSKAQSSYSCGVCSLYHLNDDSKIRFKVNSDGLFGIGFQQKICDGVTMMLSTLIDGRNLTSSSCHKVGIGIELDSDIQSTPSNAQYSNTPSVPQTKPVQSPNLRSTCPKKDV